jgi:AcrR family transcriptional regulator
MGRRYHHGDLREAVLRLAMVSIETGGVGALSLRDLGRACGVNPTAPNRHFPTKKDLLDALAVRGYEELAQTLAAARCAGPIETVLTAFGQAYAGFARDHPALLTLMFSRRFDHAGPADVAAAAVAAYSPIDEALDAARERGEVAGDRDAVGAFVRIVLRGLATSVSNGALDNADSAAARAVMSAAVLGLRPR